MIIASNLPRMGLIVGPPRVGYNAAMGQTLTVNEIFLSLQGEGLRTGMPCAFVRLAGCNLRCRWCDTTYALTEGEEMELSDILMRVGRLGCKRVEVTGGEPLIQKHTPELLRRFCDAGYETLLETNGSLDISTVDEPVVRIVDFKCPSSGEQDANCWANVERLTSHDEVKFVIADRTDYDFARDTVAERRLLEICPVTFQPVAGVCEPAKLAGWILSDGLDVRLGLQLHKILWPGRKRGV
ncbi:MAG: radical SAM protein [Phycisphaerae bacterium]